MPTWNYIAVHAYGVPRLIEESVRVRAVIERLVERHEAGRATPWRIDSQEKPYVAAMLRGIVAFEIPIARFEAKAKLNQNKGPQDRTGVVAGLCDIGDPQAAALADVMESWPFDA